MNNCHRAVLLALSALGTALLNTGCDRLSSAVEVSVNAMAEPTAAPLTVGRHDLTASPPVTVSDLDRLVDLGMTNDQVVSEIERRGVLKLPDPGERAHIQRLPRGDRLLDTMESPKNLLTAEAVTRFGQRQAGAPNIEQWQAARSPAARTGVYPASAQASSVRQQQYSDYQQRKNALSSQIFTLKQRRLAMQRRGRGTTMIGIEIDRLERELTALVPPV